MRRVELQSRRGFEIRLPEPGGDNDPEVVTEAWLLTIIMSREQRNEIFFALKSTSRIDCSKLSGHKDSGTAPKASFIIFSSYTHHIGREYLESCRATSGINPEC